MQDLVGHGVLPYNDRASLGRRDTYMVMLRSFLTALACLVTLTSGLASATARPAPEIEGKALLREAAAAATQ